MAAALLLLCFFLPLSHCSGTDTRIDDSSGVTANVSNTANTVGTEKVGYSSEERYAFSNFNPLSMGSWSIFILLLWPFPILIAYKNATIIRRRILLVAEPIIGGFLGYAFIAQLYLFDSTPLLGGYVGILAYFIYACAWSVDFIYFITRGSKYRVR